MCPNRLVLVGFSYEENAAWQIEEFRGPQRGPRFPRAPGGKRKKDGVESGTKENGPARLPQRWKTGEEKTYKTEEPNTTSQHV